MRVPTTPAHLFFLRKKTPASQKARVGTSTVSLARGANREVKERVKGKASRVQSTRIGSAIVCVRRNVQHRELKLLKSTRFALVTVVMVAVPTGCIVSPPVCVCVCVCVFIKLHITTQSGPVILVSVCVCVCVFSSHSFWTSSSLDVPAGVTQEEGHTGFFIHLLSAVRALIFLARRIQPILSLVDREVEFCVLTI